MRAWIGGSAGLLMQLALLAGCAVDRHQIFVDLRTDFAPGTEAARARTELLGSSLPPVLTVLEAGAPVFEGVRIAELDGVPAGNVTIRVTLLAADGEALATGETRVAVQASLVVSFVLTRACRGVVCPRLGDDPSWTRCVGGVCVAPDCEGGGCPGVCEGDDDCATTLACAVPRCIDGVCLLHPQDDLCAMGERCSLDLGCVSAGADAGADAGTDAAAPIDAGPPCVPVVEACNGLDEDCDALVDEDFDLANDASHCGACDVVCATDESCSSGRCSCDSGACPSQQLCCGLSRCVPMTTARCSSCSSGCDSRADQCEAGRCFCGEGPPCSRGTCCAGDCVTLSTDAANCGRCGNVCTSGCDGGVCRCTVDSDCADSEMCCDGACTDVATNASHCGACGTVCSDGSDCCAGACVDLQTSDTNCGECGFECSFVFLVCEAGRCTSAF